MSGLEAFLWAKPAAVREDYGVLLDSAGQHSKIVLATPGAQRPTLVLVELCKPLSSYTVQWGNTQYLTSQWPWPIGAMEFYLDFFNLKGVAFLAPPL